jgi:hypothetical protein
MHYDTFGKKTYGFNLKYFIEAPGIRFRGTEPAFRADEPAAFGQDNG